MKRLIRGMIPSVLFDLRRRVSRFGWHGDFPDWDTARARSTGYDCDVILERVTHAVVAVREGRAAFERDSVALPHPEYRWPLLASLAWATAARAGQLAVMDIGGSLGSAYLQHRTFFADLPELRWVIVEQPHFVARGRALFKNEPVEFYETVEECVSAVRPDFVLFGSSLQYFREPHACLAKALESEPEYLVIDRTPFIDSGRDRLTVQSVSPEIYSASYPCWLFDRESFLGRLKRDYQVVAELPCDDRGNLRGLTFRGFLFRRFSRQEGE